MRKFHQYLSLLLMLLLATIMVSCSEDDDDGDSAGISVADVAGEWYVETGASTSDYKDCITFTLGKDGSYKSTEYDIYKYAGEMFTAEGTYSISGKKLRIQFSIYGETASSMPQITSLGNYDMTLFYPDTQIEERDHRIVDTWHMKVGDKDEVFINDPDFMAVEYSSNDERVATVSPTGMVEAVRQGTAYIMAVSPIGTAVIRVVVEHPQMIIDDCMAYFGEDISVATKVYGNLYNDLILSDDDGSSGLKMRHYFLADDKISELGFVYNENGVIEDIRLLLRGNDILEPVVKAITNMYEFRAEHGSNLIYRASKNSRRVAIIVDTSIGLIQYLYESNNDPYAIVDELASMTLSEILEKLNYEITDADRTDGYFIVLVNSQVCSSIVVYFDEAADKINILRLRFREDISYEEVDNWYAQHYIATGYDDEDWPRYYQYPSTWVYLSIKNGIVQVTYYL